LKSGIFQVEVCQGGLRLISYVSYMNDSGEQLLQARRLPSVLRIQRVQIVMQTDSAAMGTLHQMSY